QGEGAAPVRREAHHEGQEGRGPRAPAGDRDDPRPGRHAQAVRRHRAALLEPTGWVPADPQAGSPSRRQRAHGARRAGVTLFEASNMASLAADRDTRPAAARSACDPLPARTHLALLVAYDGTDFHGFAAQPEQRTVAGVLLEALQAMLRGDVQDFAGAGRTDSGVHAWGQVVSISTAAAVEPNRLAHALTKRMGPEVVVRSARVVKDGFDARHSAVARTYRYTVVN